MKIYVVGGDTYYPRWIKDYVLTNKLEEADIVYFTGGADVTPSLYGCKKHHTTYNNLERDLEEKEIFNRMRLDQIAVGSCRGSQLLCILNGGILIQNCRNHAIWGTHMITDGTDEYPITSTHHQMAYPFYMLKSHYDILLWADHLSDIYEGDRVDPSLVDKEPEVVLYHVPGKPISLGIQGHPEIMRPGDTWNMLNKILEDAYIRRV